MIERDEEKGSNEGEENEGATLKQNGAFHFRSAGMCMGCVKVLAGRLFPTKNSSFYGYFYIDDVNIVAKSKI